MSYVAMALGAIDCETARHPFDWWVVRSGTQGYKAGGGGLTSRTSGPVPVPADMWNCLVKQQSDPYLKAATAQLACGTGFVFTDDVQGCVNKNGVTMLTAAASNCKSGVSTWWMCTPLLRYMHVNEDKALSDACAAEEVASGWRFKNLLAAFERAVEAMQEWRGGWANVKSQVHAVSVWVNYCSGGHRIAIDELDDLMLESVAKYYDQRRSAWDQILAAEKAPPLSAAQYLRPGLLSALVKPGPTKKATAALIAAPTMSPMAAVAIGMGVAAVAVGGALWYMNKKSKRTR